MTNNNKYMHTHVIASPTFLLSPMFPPWKLVLFGVAGTMQETVGWFPVSEPPVGNKEEDKSYQPF
jgi:hypothetical protein